MTTEPRPLSLAKLLSYSDADCTVEAILLLMLSLVDSGSSRCRDRAQVVETSVTTTDNNPFQVYTITCYPRVQTIY